MKGTRFRRILRECAGRLHREIKIGLTPIPKNKKWVFLVGCYNSGTTLLAEILGKHPSISALPTEGHFITDQFVKDYEIGLPRMWVEREDIFRLNENDEGPDSYRLTKEWAMRLNCRKPVLLEKSPPNSAKTRWLQKHFENAYFVAIVRDAYAVAEGISRKAQPQHLKDGWPLEMSAYQWMRSNQVLQEDAKHLNRVLWIKYEDLTGDSVATLNRITDFIGIQSFPNYNEGQEWSIHERKEPLRNMNPESHKRMSAEQIEIVNKVAGEMIENLGYEKLKAN